MAIAEIEMAMKITTHPSAQPAALHAGLDAALRAGRVPGRVLYESPRQAQLWLAYHQAWSPSRGDGGLRAAYQTAFEATAHTLNPARPVHLVGLGSGGGGKDAALLAVLERHTQAELCYSPLDVSAALVRTAALAARESRPGLTLRPLVADLEALTAQPGDLSTLLDPHAPAGACRVLSCFGMLPNMPPDTFPALLRALLRPDLQQSHDALLISANLCPGSTSAARSAILSQYDNPPARAWYNGALAELGMTEADITVSAGNLRDDGGLWQVQVTARSRQDVMLNAGTHHIPWPADRPLDVFHSLRFTQDGAEAYLNEAGLPVQEHWSYAAGEEAIYLCVRGGS